MPANSTLHRVFCQNLRAIRKAKSLTQEQMAERLGMTQSQYAKIETGSNVPILTMVERISVALGVTVSDLLDAAVAA